jgi:hypothetical protein
MSVRLIVRVVAVAAVERPGSSSAGRAKGSRREVASTARNTTLRVYPCLRRPGYWGKPQGLPPAPAAVTGSVLSALLQCAGAYRFRS